MKKLLSTYCLLHITSYIALAQLPAFPGASGFGKEVTGGRGGAIIEVTNLNDNGSGSFREAIYAQGPRTIVFRVGGIINLISDLQVTEPNLTIAAQTAPGDGIVLKNFSLDIFTNNIIIRGMRFRMGDDADGAQADLRDCVTMQTGAHHIIFDHCSFSWGLDENVSMMDSAHHITVQWSITSEALFKNRHPKGPHSMAFLVDNGSNAISLHHNLFAHNNGRNPLVMGSTDMEFINNVIYDWGYSSEFLENGGQLLADISGNYWKPLTSNPGSEHPLAIDFDYTTPFNTRLYCANNIDQAGLFLTEQEIAGFGDNAVLFSSTSLMTEQTGIPFSDATTNYNEVVAGAGAIHPQRDATDIRIALDVFNASGDLVDCMYPDPILLDSGIVMSGTDTSIVYSQLLVDPAISPEGRRIDIVSGTGAGQSRTGIDVRVIDEVNRIIEGIVDAPWDVVPDNTSHYSVTAACDNNLGGWPVYTAGTPYTDTDHDGMSDDWETSHSLNPSDATDRNGFDVNDMGYTNLEVYLNEYYTPNSNTGIADRSGNFIKVYPNPANDLARIESTINGTLEITNSFGRLVTLSVVEGPTTIINISSLSTGVYFLTISNQEKQFHTKFIKE